MGKDAACTETGLTDGKHCSVCNTVIVNQEIIPANGHNEVTDARVEAACTENGLTEGSHCSVCNVVFVKQEIIPAMGHNPIKVDAKEPTCTQVGLKSGSFCTVCNAVLEASQVIPALGHKAVTNSAVAATCTKAGLTESQYCSVCHVVLKAQEKVSAKGHTEKIDKERVEPTCTTTGTTASVCCSVCGVTISSAETIPALEHEFVEMITVPTCTEEGNIKNVCTICGETEDAEVLEALGHEFGVWESRDAGTHARTCQREGCAEESVVACENHFTYTLSDKMFELCPVCPYCNKQDDSVMDLNKVTIISAQSVEQAGNIVIHGIGSPFGEERVCINEYLPETDLTVLYAISVAAEEDGVLVEWPAEQIVSFENPVEGDFVLVCVKVDSKTGEKTLETVEYVLDDGLVTMNVDEPSMFMLIHIEEDHIEVIDSTGIPASCEQNGLTSASHCEVCGKSLQMASVIETTGHKLVADEAVSADCKHEGHTEGEHCEVCGIVTIEASVIPKTSHAWVIIEPVAATCSNEGLTAGAYCTICGEVMIEQTCLPKLEHTVVIDPAVDPSSGQTGLTEGSHCSVCGVTIVEQQIIR